MDEQKDPFTRRRDTAAPFDIERLKSIVYQLYDSVRSYVHVREHLAACEGIPQSLQPDNVLRLSPGPHVYGEVPILKCGPFHTVQRHCCKHGLERHVYPPSPYFRQVTHRRPTTCVQSSHATVTICDITYYIATNPLGSIQVTLHFFRLG
jgi:hypothetical protein